MTKVNEEMGIKVKNSENQICYDWFNELKQKQMKSGEVTGYSDNFNKKLQFKMFLKRLQWQSKKKVYKTLTVWAQLVICILYRKEYRKYSKILSDNLWVAGLDGDFPSLLCILLYFSRFLQQWLQASTLESERSEICSWFW